MKAKLVNENLEFKRGQDPKDAMDIGIHSNIQKFFKWLEWDFQFRKNKPEYYFGYVNIGPVDINEPAFFNSEVDDGYERFIRDWKRYLPALKKINRYIISPPNYDETIIYDEEILKSNRVLESLDFERGQDPKDAMDIGRKSLLKKQSESIEWDWRPDPEDHEEIIDIIHYPKDWDENLYIKISKLSDDSGFAYFAVNNLGEPYHQSPAIFDTPEKALSVEKEFLDEYYEE